MTFLNKNDLQVYIIVYLIQMICTLLYGFKHYNQIQVIMCPS